MGYRFSSSGSLLISYVRYLVSYHTFFSPSKTMEQTRALNALEPFLALSKSANSPRAAADLIVQATSAPSTFVFAELLHAPTIQALRDSPEYAAYLQLLQVFAWGTWQDYAASKSQLPALSDAQTTKLKLLSLLPLSADPTNLSYATLQSRLDLPTPRALEDLLITAIYAHLITATLDPASSRVSITSVAPLRDLSPASAGALVAELGAWGRRCDDTLASLEAEMAAVRKRALDRELRRRRTEAVRAAVEKAHDDREKPQHAAAVAAVKRAAAAAADDDDDAELDAMELDDEVPADGDGGAGTESKGLRGAKSAKKALGGKASSAR
ncbi:COP9 signalosome subunit 7 [Phyllosticta citricarpa]